MGEVPNFSIPPARKGATASSHRPPLRPKADPAPQDPADKNIVKSPPTGQNHTRGQKLDIHPPLPYPSLVQTFVTNTDGQLIVLGRAKRPEHIPVLRPTELECPTCHAPLHAGPHLDLTALRCSSCGWVDVVAPFQVPYAA